MPVIELLQGHHDRKGFDCGKDSLNMFLQRQARQNADRNIGVTHVVVAAPGDSRILGYYTLVTRHIESGIIPAKKRNLTPQTISRPVPRNLDLQGPGHHA